jgi:hypothetical protein
MYRLGVFLGLASSWMTLRALRSERRQRGWWIVYGLTSAVFCLTHYFAAFAVFAQGLFILVEVARLWCTGARRRALSVMLGSSTAIALCAALALPWMPVVANQVRSVRQGYWIPPLTRQALDDALFCWTTGVPDPPTLPETWVVRVLLAATFAGALWRLRPGGLLFALQAAVPWFLCLGLCATGGQSLFQERYLIFSQVGLFGMLAVVMGRRGWLPVRVGLICVVYSLTLCGTFEHVLRFPVEPSRAACAIGFVAQHAQAGDTVIASSYRTLNRLRYYASEARLDHVRICCLGSLPTRKGHVVHAASLNDGDFVSLAEADRPNLRRAWFVFDPGEELPFVPSGLRQADAYRFEGRTDSVWVAALYVGEGNSAARHVQCNTASDETCSEEFHRR